MLQSRDTFLNSVDGYSVRTTMGHRLDLDVLFTYHITDKIIFDCARSSVHQITAPSLRFQRVSIYNIEEIVHYQSSVDVVQHLLGRNGSLMSGLK